jgi:hypothetical protein
MTIDELKEKISKVSKDIENISSEGGTIQAVSTLASYKEYLEDELKMMEEHARNNRRKSF